MLLANLLSTDYGMGSLAVIAFVLIIGYVMYSFVKRNMEKDAKNAGK
jgi:hypothetical protein